jgi:hypothetical protein
VNNTNDLTNSEASIKTGADTDHATVADAKASIGASVDTDHTATAAVTDGFKSEYKIL